MPRERRPRARRGALLILTLTLALAPAEARPPKNAGAKAANKAPRQKARVRHINIVQKDIFDSAVKSESALPYRLANGLHVTTKKSAIRRQLLFKEGDEYDPAIAKETERALRRILRLRSVRVTPVPVGPGLVDVVVQTQETWTTEPTLSFSGVGEDLTGKVGFRERNLLGYGKNASFFYKKEPDLISRSFSYQDPAFLNTPLRLDGDYDDSEDGTVQSLFIEKPYFSSVTPWSARAQAASREQRVRLFSGGRETGRLRQDAADLSAGLSFSLRSTTRHIRRMGLSYRFSRDKLSGESGGAALRDERYHVFSWDAGWERVDFLTVDHIKQYDRDEDFALGPALSVDAGFSRGKWVRGAEDADFYGAQAFQGLRLGPSHFLLATFQGRGRRQGGSWRGARPRFDLEYYNHFHARQTLACHFQAEGILSPGPDEQVLLGGDNGLRGYSLNQFAGNRLLLVNVENRFFVIDDILRLASLGTAAFFDAGYVWPRGEPVKARDIKANIGAGLRFHLNRTSLGHVLRLDAAYALNAVRGEDRLVITFGSEQAF